MTKRTQVPCIWGLIISAAFMSIPQSAEAGVLNLVANLDQSQEVVPPIVSTNASGFANLTYDTDSNLLIWDIRFSGLSSPLTAAHFHGPAAIGASGLRIIEIDSISGLVSPLLGSFTLTEGQEKDILAGLWYINLHTAANPTGEIRGQISTVPEPSSLGFLVMAGVSFLGYQLRQKKFSK